MITDAIRLLTRVTFAHTAVMVLMVGILWGTIIGGGPEIGSLLIALVVYVVLVVTVSIIFVVVTRRTDKALIQEAVSASPAIVGGQHGYAAPSPAQIVRRRISRKSNAYAAGYAPAPPPALVMMLRVIAPEGARLAIALAPTTVITSRARSHVGVRLDPTHPDVAVLDPSASPEEMRVQYEAAMALPGFKKPAVGWGSTTRWALYGLAAGLSAGLVIGLLLP